VDAASAGKRSPMTENTFARVQDLLDDQ